MLRGSVGLKTFAIAVIAGDGIGREVVPEGIRVLEAAGTHFGFRFEWHSFDWSCETYLASGKMMPGDGLSQLRKFDAIYLGAVECDTRRTDHISLWGVLIPIRRTFQQYVNLRPFQLSKGFDSFEQPDRPQVDVLLKGAANRNQHSPKRDMIRHVGASDCPKIYRVKFTKLAEAIAWHHLA